MVKLINDRRWPTGIGRGASRGTLVGGGAPSRGTLGERWGRSVWRHYRVNQGGSFRVRSYHWNEFVLYNGVGDIILMYDRRGGYGANV